MEEGFGVESFFGVSVGMSQEWSRMLMEICATKILKNILPRKPNQDPKEFASKTG